ncbi:hypothetical protein AB6D08_17750 [Vibrio splendidus]
MASSVCAVTNEPYDQKLKEEGDIEYVIPFNYLAKNLYISTVFLLSSRGLESYLLLFYKLFGEDPNSPRYLEEFDINYYISGQAYSKFLEQLTQFLSVFDFLEFDEDRYLRISGLRYLETVLRNTASIVSKTGKKPNSETDVYKTVKVSVEAIFPSSKKPKSNFIKHAKEYKPDILIPELYTAVEYKYAKDEEKLKSTIEQICIDVKGYTGDKDYTVFYAVFYVTEDFWGFKKFKSVWNDYDFPKNWVPIYVVGK